MSDDDEIFDERTWTVFGEGKLGCPVCGIEVPVPVLACIDGDSGELRLELKPDMSETWAHMFTHEEAPNG